jgi:resuscitation-promoting factor RpfB
MRRTVWIAMLSVALLAGGHSPASATTDSGSAPTPTASASGTPQLTATAKKVSLQVRAAKTRQITTKALTVADLLIERKIALSEADVVKPALTTRLVKKLKILIKRIQVSTVTRTETVAAPMVKHRTAKLRRGVTKIRLAGTPGQAQRTYTVTTVNGKVSSKVLLTQTLLLAPVPGIVDVGTKGKRLNLARMKMWNRIARCESGGRWHINTGNGYYGGLQFNLATWRANGGRDFAARPHKASKGEQVTVANRLYAQRGTRPWSCA